jgi:hypothetical protein
MAFSALRHWWRGVPLTHGAPPAEAPAADPRSSEAPPPSPADFAEGAVLSLAARATVLPADGAADVDRREARFVLRALADVSALVLYLLEGGHPDEELIEQLTAQGITDAQLEAAALAYNPTHDPVADGRLAIEATLQVWLAARNAPDPADRAEARGHLNDVRLTATPTMRDRHLLFAYLYGATEPSWGARGRGRAALGHVRLAGVEDDGDEPITRPRAPGTQGLSESLLLAADFSAAMDEMQERYVSAPDDNARAAALAGVQHVTDLLTALVVDRGPTARTPPAGSPTSADSAGLDAMPKGAVEDNAMAALAYTIRVWRIARNSPDAAQRATARAYLDEIRAMTSATPGDRHRAYAAALASPAASSRGRAAGRAGPASGERPRLVGLPKTAGPRPKPTTGEDVPRR